MRFTPVRVGWHRQHRPRRGGSAKPIQLFPASVAPNLRGLREGDALGGMARRQPSMISRMYGARGRCDTVRLGRAGSTTASVPIRPFRHRQVRIRAAGRCPRPDPRPRSRGRTPSDVVVIPIKAGGRRGASSCSRTWASSTLCMIGGLDRHRCPVAVPPRGHDLRRHQRGHPSGPGHPDIPFLPPQAKHQRFRPTRAVDQRPFLLDRHLRSCAFIDRRGRALHVGCP